ncbi:glycoside hydrolase family 71 protein [Daldinia caldariorum]|uniref:glycoside hydrolase family 71 protein n=1 Tax=Daldinia caldariorum TaxID=326644 RepID=UPI00200861E8|nr:glycoside hydrolase family 71 protein [Daldinia caldariorum]KAI1464407.1 glycoside hydrolase family 71 protein [Daldinia caldariorum]
MYGKINSVLALLLAGSAFITRSVVESKLVFAHYMVGSVDSQTTHAQQDIDGAINVGFDAFALNVGSPDADWAKNTIQQLFDYAGDKPFKLFFSFDFYGNGDINRHQALFSQFKDHPAHLRYNDLPVVSSYSGGNIGPDAWRNFKNTNNVYLIPNPEADGNYYNNPSAFFQSWGDAVDGVFSWETAWPETSEKPANVSSERDSAVKSAADAAGKAYVMGLSSLQYKHCCGDSWYRGGETNLPERMEQILSVSPEFTEVITWNDAGESHYIGPCWPEGLTEEILQYGNSATTPHAGWQPLIASFVDAFKAGATDVGAMKPRGANFAGAMWYRGVLTSCTGAKPRGSGAAVDAVNYAVVLPAGSTGLRVRVSSGGRVLATQPVRGGLNYNSVAGMATGAQKIELVDGGGRVIASASGAVDVTNDPANGFCNYNYYVAGLQ